MANQNSRNRGDTIKILMVNKFLYYKGGAETYFLRLGEMLKKQRHEVQYFGMADKKNVVGNDAGLSCGGWRGFCT